MNNQTQNTFNLVQVAVTETEHYLHSLLNFSEGVETVIVDTEDNLKFYHECEFFSDTFNSFHELEVIVVNSEGEDFILTLEEGEGGELFLVPTYMMDDWVYEVEGFFDFCVGCDIVQIIIKGEK